MRGAAGGLAHVFANPQLEGHLELADLRRAFAERLEAYRAGRPPWQSE